MVFLGVIITMLMVCGFIPVFVSFISYTKNAILIGCISSWIHLIFILFVLNTSFMISMIVIPFWVAFIVGMIIWSFLDPVVKD